MRMLGFFYLRNIIVLKMWRGFKWRNFNQTFKFKPYEGRYKMTMNPKINPHYERKKILYNKFRDRFKYKHRYNNKYGYKQNKYKRKSFNPNFFSYIYFEDNFRRLYKKLYNKKKYKARYNAMLLSKKNKNPFVSKRNFNKFFNYELEKLKVKKFKKLKYLKFVNKNILFFCFNKLWFKYHNEEYNGFSRTYPIYFFFKFRFLYNKKFFFKIMFKIKKLKLNKFFIFFELKKLRSFMKNRILKRKKKKFKFNNVQIKIFFPRKYFYNKLYDKK